MHLGKSALEGMELGGGCIVLCLQIAVLAAWNTVGAFVKTKHVKYL